MLHPFMIKRGNGRVLTALARQTYAWILASGSAATRSLPNVTAEPRVGVRSWHPSVSSDDHEGCSRLWSGGSGK